MKKQLLTIALTLVALVSVGQTTSVLDSAALAKLKSSQYVIHADSLKKWVRSLPINTGENSLQTKGNFTFKFQQDAKPYLIFENNGNIIYRGRKLITDTAIVSAFKAITAGADHPQVRLLQDEVTKLRDALFFSNQKVLELERKKNKEGRQ